MRYLYEAIFIPSAKGGFDVEFPELCCITQGSSLYDAACKADELLKFELAVRLKNGEAFPQPHFGHRIPNGGYAFIVSADCGEDGVESAMMTVREAADALAVSKARVYALARDGSVASQKIGNALLISTVSVWERINNPRLPGRPRKNRAAYHAG